MRELKIYYLDLSLFYIFTKEMSMTEKNQPERLESLDILRGFDMFWITGGSALIAALAKATDWQMFASLDRQMHHVPWEGFHFYDLIFPLFMFIMGVAIPYALLPRMDADFPRKKIYLKVIRRFIILVVFGIFYNQTFMPDWSHPRIASVLGQIGFAYLFAAIIFINAPSLRSVVLWIAGILVVYGLVQNLIPVPGYGAGVLTREGSLNAFLDQRITPGRLYGGTYDPEGVMNNISAIGITLMGVCAGLILRSESGQYKKFAILVTMGAGSLSLAYILRGWYPVIKSLWTSTFNLHAGGISLLLLAFFYLIVDVWNKRKWGFYFRVIGMNSITIYIGYAFIDFRGISENLFGGLTMHLGDYGEIIISLGSLAIIWICLYMLFRNRIFLRV
jgi:predicted acyltransferase